MKIALVLVLLLVTVVAFDSFLSFDLETEFHEISNTIEPPTTEDVVETPGRSSIRDTIREYIDNLPTGLIAYNPPSEMRVGDTETVEVRISENLAVDIEDALEGIGPVITESIPVGTAMRVKLFGDAFEITSMSTTEQVVVGSSFTEWKFDVTPTESGEQSLVLLVSVVVHIENSSSVTKDIPVIERQISVSVNYAWSAKRFFSEHWKWLLGTLLIPFGLWLWKVRSGAGN